MTKDFNLPIENLRQYIEEQSKKKLSNEQILWLFRKKHSRRTEKEVQQLIDANLPLVYRIADQFLQKHIRISNSNNIDLIELFQAGYLGLVKAVEKYDSYRGTKFSTYAYYLISLEVRKEINQIVYPVKKYHYATVSSEPIDASVYEIEDDSISHMQYDDIVTVSKENLTEYEYEVFVMYFDKQMTMTQIADEKKYSTSKVQYCIDKIRKKLQKVFEHPDS